MLLSDRTAIVTGASSGIGRAIATTLASEGASILIADVRESPKQGTYFDTDASMPTAELIRDRHDVDARFVQTDVSDEDDVIQLVEEANEAFGGIDILVNNAGIQIPGGTDSLSAQDWARVIGVNLSGQFFLAKWARAPLVQSEHGRIVNISSINAHFGGAGPAYAASKAGVVNLTRDLAVEFAPAEVTVNAVLPGVIKTPMQDLNDEGTIERQSDRTPLPRIGEPEDVANAVRFFASDRASWITGAELVVDGGYLAGGF